MKAKFKVGQIVGLYCVVCPVHCCEHVTTFRQILEVRHMSGRWYYMLTGLHMLRGEDQLRALNKKEIGR